MKRWLLALPALLLPTLASAQTAIPGALDRAFGATGGTGGQGMTLSLQLLIMMGLLTLLPGLLLMMTSFPVQPSLRIPASLRPLSPSPAAQRWPMSLPRSTRPASASTPMSPAAAAART